MLWYTYPETETCLGRYERVFASLAGVRVLLWVSDAAAKKFYLENSGLNFGSNPTPANYCSQPLSALQTDPRRNTTPCKTRTVSLESFISGRCYGQPCRSINVA